MKSIAAWLVCCLVSSVAFAQSEPPSKDADNSDSPFKKKSDKDNAKPNASTKNGKTAKPQPSKPGGKKSPGGSGNPVDPGDASAGTPVPPGEPVNVKINEPHWSVEKIRLAPHAAAKYTRGNVTLAPTEGNTLIEASFRLTALRSDNKAIDRYARVWNNVNRRDLTDRTRAGARLLESRNIALMNAEGRRFPALWSLDEGIRTTIINVQVAPNSQSSQQSSSGGVSPTSPWFDAEQSFMTRIIRPFNQPPTTEYATVFAGLLKTDEAFPVSFLFSVPESADLSSLRLSVDAEIFGLEE